MMNRIRKLSVNAHRSAKRSGYRALSRLAISVGTAGGAILGAYLGRRFGERLTRRFLESALELLPIPMKGSLTRYVAKRWGPEIGHYLGLFTGAAAGGAFSKRLVHLSFRLVGRSRSSLAKTSRTMDLLGFSFREFVRQKPPFYSVSPFNRSTQGKQKDAPAPLSMIHKLRAEQTGKCRRQSVIAGVVRALVAHRIPGRSG